jgi:hypothetical protein
MLRQLREKKIQISSECTQFLIAKKMKAYLLTVPNLVGIKSVCKYTQLDEGKYDLGHICPTD